MGPRDYFNVVIYNTKDGKPEGVQLKALSKEEVILYIEYVKKRQLGMQPIGNHHENVVIPDSVRIFDFSKKPTLDSENQAIHRKSIADQATFKGDFLKACEDFGRELDMKALLGFNLADILSELPPKRPDEDDSKPNEYFNLYIETPNKAYSEREIYNTFGYPVLNEGEINHYIDLLKRKSWGEHTIGKYKIDVTPPTAINIFDLSNVVQEGDDYTREELLKKVPLNPADEIPLFEQIERYGADVTKDIYGDDIEILLSQLQLDIQLSQRGINADTGEEGTFFTEGEMTGQSKEESSAEGNLGDKVSRFYPKEFQEGILDGSVEPAFNVEKVAAVFANHLKNLKHENGQMVGVFGQWGRGKTYFLKEVFSLLHTDDKKQFIQVDFQAWRYQNTPSIWAYLYQTFIEVYLKVSRCERLFRVFKLNERRTGKWKSWILPLLTILFGIVWILVFNYNDKLQGLNFLIKWSGGLVSFLTIVFKLSYFGYFSKNPAIKILNTISKVPSFQSVLGVQAEIQKELVYLIQTWTGIAQDKRILLFIDDLDRCSEHQLMNIIDSLRVMLDDEKINKLLLVLVALDEVKLIEAINGKYEKLTEEEQIPELANEYLDKLFITAFKLNPISDDERAEFIRMIAKQINQVVIEGTQTTADQGDEDTSDEETGVKKEIVIGKEQSAETVDSDHDEENSDDMEVIPVMADFKSESGQYRNLDKKEIAALSEKVKITRNDLELTPRQIRIVVYRYLLARNLWLAFYGNLDWKTDDAITEIMRLSGFSKEKPTDETKVFGGLFKICQMVVAY